jgi:hypothetical protein
MGAGAGIVERNRLLETLVYAQIRRGSRRAGFAVERWMG